MLEETNEKIELVLDLEDNENNKNNKNNKKEIEYLKHLMEKYPKIVKDFIYNKIFGNNNENK